MNMETFLLTFGTFFLILFLLGIIFMIIGVKRSKKIQNWILTEGEIVKKQKHVNITLSSIFNKNVSGSHLPDKAPTVKFEVDGTTYESTSSIEQTPGFVPGTVVELYYNPQNPEEAIINSFVQKGVIFKVLGWVFMSISITILIIGFIVYSFTNL